MRKLSLLLLGLSSLAACQKTAENGHAHGDATHGAQGRVDTTIWTQELELFVEYPAFVLGQTSRFAAHFTLLEGHQPIAEGSVTASLIQGKKGIRHTVKAASRPGIFTPALQPQEAGKYQLFFDLKTPGLSARINAGRVMVYPNVEAANRAVSLGDQSEPEISFLKEQAWKTDFQTTLVKKDTVYGIEKLAGKWMPAPGTHRTLNAGSSGNVLYEIPGLVEGLELSQGSVLMRISGKNMNLSSIASEVQKAKAQFEQAKSEYERKKELHKLQVVPASELEGVKKRYLVAQTHYQQLVQNFGADGVAIRAPFDGYVKHISVENGAFVNAGQPLLSLGTKGTRMIEAKAAPEKRNKIMQTKKVWIVENGKNLPVNGKVVSVGRNVSKNQPMLPVFLEVKAPRTTVEGSLAEVQLGYTSGEMGLMIPKSALLEDFGAYKVIVQTGGEAFEIRQVEVGNTNGDQVAIVNGLEENEWLVTKGAYQVKMASMSGAPAHGHAH